MNLQTMPIKPFCIFRFPFLWRHLMDRDVTALIKMDQHASPTDGAIRPGTNEHYYNTISHIVILKG